MTEMDRFRKRLAAAGTDIPESLADLIAGLAGPMLLMQDHLVGLDLADTEPFCPARRLPDDAAA